MTRKSRTWPWALLVILAVGLALRVGVAWRAQMVGLAALNPDSHDYVQCARNLVERATYSRASEPPFAPDAYRTPGYPVLLALPYLLTRDFGLAVPLQIGLDLLIVVLLYHLVAESFDRRGALVAAGAYALDWSAAVYANSLLSETLCAACLIALFLVLGRTIAKERGLLWLAVGACAGATVLTRAYFLPLLPLLLVGILMHWRRRAGAPLGLTVLGMAVILGPWAARNYYHWGTPMVTSIGGATLYYFNVAHLRAAESGISAEEAVADVKREADAILAPEPEYAFRNSAILTSMALREFLKDPPLTAALWGKGAGHALLGFSQGALQTLAAEHYRGLRLPVATMWCATVLMAFVGALRGMRRARVTTGLWAGLVLLTLLTAFLQGYARFRVPVDWAICALAGTSFCGRKASCNSEDASLSGQAGGAGPSPRPS